MLPTLTPLALQGPSFPNVGSVDDALKFFEGLLFDKLGNAYDVPRVALGIVAMHPAADRAASYQELTNLLSTISPKLENATEFQYQINRPRESSIIPGMTINRLSRWASVVMAGVTMPFRSEGVASTVGQFLQTKQIFATRVELDLSTPSDRLEPLPVDSRVDLLRDLAKLVPEILQKGDIE